MYKISFLSEIMDISISTAKRVDTFIGPNLQYNATWESFTPSDLISSASDVFIYSGISDPAIIFQFAN